MNDGVLFTLSLHLPLNLIRRLAGLNRTLNRVMLSEHLWRVRCEREFPVLRGERPPGGATYRYYFLMCSNSARGDDTPVEDHNSSTLLRSSYHLLGDELFAYARDRSPTNIVPNVVYVRDNLIRDTEGRHFVIDSYSEQEASFVLIRLPWSDGKIVKLLTIGEMINTSLMFGPLWSASVRLYDDGVCIVERSDKSVQKLYNILDVTMLVDALFLLHLSGRLEVQHVSNGEGWSSENMSTQKYIRLSPTLINCSGEHFVIELNGTTIVIKPHPVGHSV